MSGSLPADLRVPSLAAAKPVARVPKPGALPGGCLYEPKWDGFRASVTTTDAGVTLWSRQGKDLTRYSVGLMRPALTFGLVTVQFSVRDRCRSLV